MLKLCPGPVPAGSLDGHSHEILAACSMVSMCSQNTCCLFPISHCIPSYFYSSLSTGFLTLLLLGVDAFHPAFCTHTVTALHPMFHKIGRCRDVKKPFLSTHCFFFFPSCMLHSIATNSYLGILNLLKVCLCV